MECAHVVHAALLYHIYSMIQLVVVAYCWIQTISELDAFQVVTESITVWHNDPLSQQRGVGY